MREENTHKERKGERVLPKKRECSRSRGRSGVAGHVEKGFWAVAPFFISHPRSPRLPCPPPAHLVRVYKICRSFSFNYFLHNFLVSCADCCFTSSLSPFLLPLSFCFCRLSLFFFVSPYIFLVLLINLGVRLRVLLCRWGPS